MNFHPNTTQIICHFGFSVVNFQFTGNHSEDEIPDKIATEHVKIRYLAEKTLWKLRFHRHLKPPSTPHLCDGFLRGTCLIPKGLSKKNPPRNTIKPTPGTKLCVLPGLTTSQPWVTNLTLRLLPLNTCHLSQPSFLSY